MKKFDEFRIEGFDDAYPENGIYEGECTFKDDNTIEWEVEFDEGFFYLRSRFVTLTTPHGVEGEYEFDPYELLEFEDALERNYKLRP